jgi:hypothetical protein
MLRDATEPFLAAAGVVLRDERYLALDRQKGIGGPK